MSDSVLMPALGESVTEGTVTRWLKQVGDQVEVDEPLLEVSTDKVDTEIPSPFAGTLTEILVQEDETVEVGTALARIGGADEGTGDGAGGQQASGQGAGGQEAGGQEAGGQGGDGVADQAEAAGSGNDDGPSDTAAGADEQQAAQVPPELTGETSSEGSDGGGGEQPSQGASGAGTDGDTQDITMPALGESVTEGTVTRWLKQVGDQVEVDEALLEVSTDKVDTEIPSPFAGTLTEIVAAEDETVEVGAVLARIGSAGQAGGQGDGAQAPGTETGASSSGGTPTRDDVGQDQASQQPQPLGAPQGQDAPEHDEAAPGQDSTPALDPAGGQDAQEEGRQADATAAAPEAPTAQEEEVSAPQPSAAAPENPAPGQQADRESQVSSPAPGQSSQRSAGGGAAGGYLTPLVRKLATDKGVDLSEITGTGVGGRIRKEDVLEAAAAADRRREQERADRERAEQERAAQQSAAQPSSAPAGGGGQSGDRAAAAPSPLRGTTEKASRLRQIIASRMVESLQSMAQLTTVVEVDVTKVVRLRARAKNDFAAREGVNLTFLPFFVLAATEALKEHPKVNGILEGNQITYHGEENVGIAVDTARGLVVPVIRGAGDLNLAGIARKIADLAARTRDNKVTPDELSGATFTVTNTGSGGALFDTPIVPAGTSAILGTGAIVKRPMVATDPDGGEYIAVRSMCYLALSYDHRLVDGADASRYLATVKKRIEEGDFGSEVGL